MPSAWGDDPELLATFRAEVEERLASLQSGLLDLERHSSPRQVVAGLFRDAHTVKGSARMLGLEHVLRVAHSMEDLLGGLRDGRLTVTRDVVDLLLAACDGIARALPGVDAPLDADALAPLVAALQASVAGKPVQVPVLAAAAPPPAPVVEAPAPAAVEPVVPPQPASPAEQATRTESLRAACSAGDAGCGGTTGSTAAGAGASTTGAGGGAAAASTGTCTGLPATDACSAATSGARASASSGASTPGSARAMP
ncbi:MAG TPA: Hpt domain-containing protein, partial [Mycobacteriales bacterium]|nr:Hpt domain-containing protein [Mycobacteriales bacterium]